MLRPFLTEGRRRLFAQMLMNVCQYLLIGAIASELLKIPLVHRVIIFVAAVVCGVAALVTWPREVK